MASPLPSPLARWLPAALFTAALAAAFWHIPEAPAPKFVATTTSGNAAADTAVQAEMLPSAGRGVASPTLAELPDGRLACAWLADADDTNAIWFSVRERQGWREPGRAATRESTAGALFARVDRLNTPILHAEGGWLHLWYASTAAGTGIGPALNHSVSTDSGASWGRVSRLPVTLWPFSGIRLSAPPTPLEDGGLALSVSLGGLTEHAGWLRLSATGQILDLPRMGDAPGTSPAVAVLGGQRGLAVSAAPPSPSTASTVNGGISWQAGEPLPIAVAGNTPLALLRLRDGRLLLAANATGEEKVLQLWLGDAEGHNWQLARVVERASDGAADFAEPALLQSRDGRIHLAYAWRHQAIRHLTFGEGWLKGEAP